MAGELKGLGVVVVLAVALIRGVEVLAGVRQQALVGLPGGALVPGVEHPLVNVLVVLRMERELGVRGKPCVSVKPETDSGRSAKTHTTRELCFDAQPAIGMHFNSKPSVFAAANPKNTFRVRVP